MRKSSYAPVTFAAYGNATILHGSHAIFSWLWECSSMYNFPCLLYVMTYAQTTETILNMFTHRENEQIYLKLFTITTWITNVCWPFKSCSPSRRPALQKEWLFSFNNSFYWCLQVYFIFYVFTRLLLLMSRSASPNRNRSNYLILRHVKLGRNYGQGQFRIYFN